MMRLDARLIKNVQPLASVRWGRGRPFELGRTGGKPARVYIVHMATETMNA